MITITSQLYNHEYQYPKFIPLVNSISITSSYPAFSNITEKSRYEKPRAMKCVNRVSN